MEFTNNPRQNPAPRPRPAVAGRPGQTVTRRPINVVNDFGARPQPAARPPKPAPAAQPKPVSAQPHTKAVHHKPLPTQPMPPRPPREDILHEVSLHTDTHKASEHHAPHPKQTHSGTVGLVVFALLCVVALAPFISGTILQNFPASSEITSTGDQAIACASDVGHIDTTTSYDYKRGFPIVYSYQTTSVIKANCNGTPKQATGGHTSQFNPLGGVIDIAAAALVAIIVAKVWRRLRQTKH